MRLVHSGDVWGFWRGNSVPETCELGPGGLLVACTPPSERPFARVVPRATVRLVRTPRRRVRQVYPQLTEFRIRIALRRIVRQQILRPQFVADLLERVVQLRQGRCVVILPARVR